MMQYNLTYRTEPTNRLNSGPGSSYRGSSTTRVYNNNELHETPRFNTNSLTVTNPLLGEHRRNFNHSPLTTTSTAMNNSPNTALSDNRNTYYENSGDDEHTNDDNYRACSPGDSPDTGHRPPSITTRPRTNSLFDRHSWYYAGEEYPENEAVAAAIAEAKRKLAASKQQRQQSVAEKVSYVSDDSYSGSSYCYTVSSDSSVSLSTQIEPPHNPPSNHIKPPPVPPKLYYAKLDGEVVVAATINNNDWDKDKFATIRSTAVWRYQCSLVSKET